MVSAFEKEARSVDLARSLFGDDSNDPQDEIKALHLDTNTLKGSRRQGNMEYFTRLLSSRSTSSSGSSSESARVEACCLFRAMDVARKEGLLQLQVDF